MWGMGGKSLCRTEHLGEEKFPPRWAQLEDGSALQRPGVSSAAQARAATVPAGARPRLRLAPQQLLHKAGCPPLGAGGPSTPKTQPLPGEARGGARRQTRGRQRAARGSPVSLGAGRAPSSRTVLSGQGHGRAGADRSPLPTGLGGVSEQPCPEGCQGLWKESGPGVGERNVVPGQSRCSRGSTEEPRVREAGGRGGGATGRRSTGHQASNCP